MSKFPVLLVFFGILNVQASVYSQSEYKVTLSLRNVGLKEVIWAIEKQTPFTFMYNIEDILNINKIDAEFKTSDVTAILDKCLMNTGITYVIQDAVIVLKPALITTQQNQQSVKISGVVSDANKVPLPGITIKVVGTQVGAVTNNEGKYAISFLPSKGTVLEFSYIGMETVRVEYSGQKEINIVLYEKVAEIDDIIVTGYQKIKKDAMPGSVAKIKGEELYKNGTNSIEQMLQGQLAGVMVINPDGKVGTRSNVRVRGTSTLLGSQEPVWVVDGIIQEDPLPFKAQELDTYGNISSDNFDVIRNFVGSSISWLNPNDIEEITVLKDASATALYGVKAANGVIVITTKQGEKGKMSITYNGGISLSNRLSYKKMNLMNSKERIDVSREIYDKKLSGATTTEQVGYEYAYWRYLNKELTYEQFNAEVKRLEAVNTDWLDILFRSSVSHNHSVSVSGGSDLAVFYASVFMNQTIGTAKGNDSDRYGGSIRVRAKLHPKVDFGMNLNGSFTKTNSFYMIDPYTYATKTSRAIPCYNEDGTLFYYNTKQSASDYGQYKYNVLHELANSGNKNDNLSLSAVLNLEYRILPGLDFTSVLGLSSSNTVGESYATERSNSISILRGYEYGMFTKGETQYDGSQLPHGGELNSTENRTRSLTWRNSVRASKTLNEVHSINVEVGQEIRSTGQDGYNSTVYGYLPDRGKNIVLPPLTYNYMGTVYSNTIIYGRFANKKTDVISNSLSYYGTMNYVYDRRYVLTGSIRYDASNRFGEDKRNRFLPTWSVGGRWNVLQEHWMAGQNVLSELNLRTSYGWQGNLASNVGPNLVATIPSNPIDSGTGEYYLKIRNLAYADLRWEKSKTVNIGIDAGFFKNRFTFIAEYYHKKIVDLISKVNLPSEYGVVSMPVNSGTMTNRGVELSMNASLIRNSNFGWTVGFNTEKTFNKVTSDIVVTPSWQYAASGSYYRNGYPVSGFWAFDYIGPNPETGVPEFRFPSASEDPDAITDVTQCMKYMGRMDPDFSGGFNMMFRYKFVSLSANFNFQVGGKKFLYQMFQTNEVPSAYSNLPREFVNRWRNPGDESRIPSIPHLTEIGSQYMVTLPTVSGSSYYAWTLYNYSSDRVVDASFLRCNNISLTVNCPKNILDILGVRSLNLTASVSNPFIIVSKDFKGLDPEVATGKQPTTRIWSFGLNFGL